MMSHRWRYKGRGSVLIRFFTSSTVRCAAARVILAIPSLFCFQSSPPLFYHSTRIGINANRFKMADEAAEAILSNDLKILFVDDPEQLNAEGFDFLRYIYAKTAAPSS